VPAAAAGSAPTARALFGGPLAATAAALTGGELSAAHAGVLAHGTHHLPHQVAAEAEAVRLEAAGRQGAAPAAAGPGPAPAGGRPQVADHSSQRRQQRPGGAGRDLEGMVAVEGLLEPEAGQLLAALEPLTRPADTHDTPSGGQRRADALAELAR
jgi:hypothetical protein